jgi:hypothetical protein
MLLKLVVALIVWLVAAIVLQLVGDLLSPDKIGVFLQNNNVIIGFLIGLCYFVFGPTWNRPAVP